MWFNWDSALNSDPGVVGELQGRAVGDALDLRTRVKDLLDQRTSRRQFIRALAAAGVALPSARALAGSLRPGRPAAPGEVIEASGGELMARTLKAAGIKYVFGIPGTDEVGFTDALADYIDLEYVIGLHEGPITAMADGYAKVSGRPAFVNVHTVAGTANALGQIVNASADGTPIVVAAGNQDSRLRGRGAFLDAPHLDELPARYAKWTWDVLGADSLPEVLRRAFTVATTPPRGPVFVTVSKDFWKATARAEIPAPERFTLAARLAPDAAAVDRAARLLVAAQSPVLLAGDELTKYGGRNSLVALAEAVAAPVVGELVTGHGLADFPTRHPQYLGLFPGAAQLALPVDLFFNAGGRMFQEFDYAAEPHLPPNVRTIHVTLDSANLGRTHAVDVPIVADVGLAIDAIAERVRTLAPSATEGVLEARRAAIAQAREAAAARRARLLQQEWSNDPISPARLAAELNVAIDEHAIVLTELVTSDAFHFDYIDYQNGEPGRLHLASNGGHLGWGIGAACGAKLAAPRREVVLLSGDGSFQFGIQGLWTAARYEIPVLFVIFNNQNYQSNRVALAHYDRRAVATGRFIGAYLGDPDIDHGRIARGYGVDGERVTSPDRVADAIRRGLASVRDGRPYVLDVVIKRRSQGAEASWHEKFSVASMR